LDEEGLPASRTAEYVIGAPSRAGRGRHSPGLTTRSEGAFLNGFAYDGVNHRLFVRDSTVNAWQPRGRILVFDVHPDRVEDGPDAIAVLGQPDFTSYLMGGVGPSEMGSIDQEALDEKNQRLFITDRANHRIMVWDIHPERLNEAPDAMVVLGQQDFFSNESGAGDSAFNRPGELHYDEESDRLFVTDMGNHRILVFDAAPGSLATGMAASLVLGQDDFEASTPGTSASHFDAPSDVEYDPEFKRLFVVDGGASGGFSSAASGRQRLLVFDATVDGLLSGASASHILGQPDFLSRQSRLGARKWTEGLELDVATQRLFANEGDRMLVFDIHPNRLFNNPDASNLLFEEDWESGVNSIGGLGMVTRTVETAVKEPILDPETQKMYTATSYTGRNAISIWDISREGLSETGTPVTDVLGQYDWAGKVDFTQRAAHGRQNNRWMYPRGVALDPMNHRLFVNDQYLHRVLVFNLDDENRPLDRQADIILGQPDAWASQIRLASERTMNIPLALAYDTAGKYLFVADGGNNRVMVFDANPDRLETFDEAIAIIGQADFSSNMRAVGADKIDMGVGYGRGIMSTTPLPMGFAVDPKGRRLFLADGANNRVTVYDIRPENIQTGMAAVAVIGQPDFESNQVRTDATGFNTPSGLDYDVDTGRLFAVDGMNSRVLVFNAAPGEIEPGQSAIAVLGQVDFTTVRPTRLDTSVVDEDHARRGFRMPSGIAYDPLRQELYVNDKGNDRVLVFDANQDILENGMRATGVIGQPDFVTRIPGFGEQEQLNDPRQIAFDSVNRRLYVTDSYSSRLMMWDLPRQERSLSLPENGMKKYATLDAWNNRSQLDNDRLGMPKQDIREGWHADLQSTTSLPGAQLVYFNTRQEMDTQTLRRSRILISETTIEVTDPQGNQLHYVVENSETRSRVVLSNHHDEPVSINFQLSLQKQQVRQTSRTLPAKTQISLTLRELFGDNLEGSGSLQIVSELELVSNVLLETGTTRDETIITGSPGGIAFEEMTTGALSGLKWGGGYSTDIVLLNPHTESIAGELTFFDPDGGAVEITGADSPSVAYQIDPGGHFLLRQSSSSIWPRQVYAVVESKGPMPSGGGILSLRNESLLVSQTMIPLRATTHYAWVPVDTLPSLIRHGKSRQTFSIANPTRSPATLRFTLFNSDGSEQGRFEQVLLPYREQIFSLADMFNVQEFQGVVRLWSDAEISLNASRITESLRREPVLSHIGYTTQEAVTEKHQLVMPGIFSGEGLATEIILVNPGEVSLDATWRFYSPEGDAKKITLR
jgi:DNA-binding beta-propeller fold protein YncE